MSNIDTLAVTMIVALRRPVGFAAACLVMGPGVSLIGRRSVRTGRHKVPDAGHAP